MNVIEQFEQFVSVNLSVNQSDRLLLAVSGGRDSMLMLWLFVQGGYSVEIAHCNFNLRGLESDGDEELVRKFAAEHNIPFHVKHFDTEHYANEQGMSIQLAARELRYTWFENLRVKANCDYIAVAHHKNDHVETVLFNLSRGTGIRGLAGIQKIREKIIRPLLFLNANEIAELVTVLGIPYRDDSSNFSNKYARNKIRLDIIPEFEKLNPEFVTVMDDNIARFQESIAVLDTFVGDLRNRLFQNKGVESWEIDKQEIYNRDIGVLYLLFEPFGFNKAVLKDLISCLQKESGRLFASEEYIILLDRTKLVLKKKLEEKPMLQLENLSSSSYTWLGRDIDVIVSDDCTIETNLNIAKVDLEKIQLPLYIRSWEEGDYFYPLGMKGKKKLSDLFIQRKINLLDKSSIPLLVNGNGEIIWVIGLQMDDRYKITQKTKKVLKLVFH